MLHRMLSVAFLCWASGGLCSPLETLFPGVWERHEAQAFAAFVHNGGAHAVLKEIGARHIDRDLEECIRAYCTAQSQKTLTDVGARPHPPQLWTAPLTHGLADAVAITLLPFLNVDWPRLGVFKEWLQAPNILLTLPRLLGWQNDADPDPFRTAALAAHAQYGEKKPFGRGWTDAMTVDLVKHVPYEKWIEVRHHFEKPGGLLINPHPMVAGPELMGKMIRYARYPLAHVAATLQNDGVRVCCRAYHQDFILSPYHYKDGTNPNPVLDFFMGVPLAQQRPIATALLLHPIRELADDCWPRHPWYLKTTPEKILEALTYLTRTPFHGFLESLSPEVRAQVIFCQCMARQEPATIPSYLAALQELEAPVHKQVDEVTQEPLKVPVRTTTLLALCGDLPMMKWTSTALTLRPHFFNLLRAFGEDPRALITTWRNLAAVQAWWSFLQHPHLMKWCTKLVSAKERGYILSSILPALGNKGETTFAHTVETLCWLRRLTETPGHETIHHATLSRLMGVASLQLEKLARTLTECRDGPSWLDLWGPQKARACLTRMAWLSSHKDRAHFVAFLNMPFGARQTLIETPMEEIEAFCFPHSGAAL